MLYSSDVILILRDIKSFRCRRLIIAYRRIVG